MRVGRKLGIDMTMQSFKRYLKILLFQAKCDMEKIKRCPWMEGNDYDRYADAVYMLKLNEDFELLLEPSEYRAIEYFHYHSPVENRPDGFDYWFASAFKKWCSVFFPNKDKRFVDVDARTLGSVMRLMREKAGRNKTELARVFGIDRTTICIF